MNDISKEAGMDIQKVPETLTSIDNLGIVLLKPSVMETYFENIMISELEGEFGDLKLVFRSLLPPLTREFVDTIYSEIPDGWYGANEKLFEGKQIMLLVFKKSEESDDDRSVDEILREIQGDKSGKKGGIRGRYQTTMQAVFGDVDDGLRERARNDPGSVSDKELSKIADTLLHVEVERPNKGYILSLIPESEINRLESYDENLGRSFREIRESYRQEAVK